MARKRPGRSLAPKPTGLPSAGTAAAPPIPLAVGAVGREWPGWESRCQQKGSGHRHPGRAPWSPARAAASGLWLPSSTTEAPPGPILPDSPSPSTSPSHPRAWEPLTPPLGPLPGPGLPTSPHHPPPSRGWWHLHPLLGHRIRALSWTLRASGHRGFPGAAAPLRPPPSPRGRSRDPALSPSVRGSGPVQGPSLLGSLLPRLLLTPNLGCPCPGSSCTPLPTVMARPAHSCAGPVSAPAVGGGRWTPGLPSAVGSFGGG
uniref:Uncharacterized protein n=1 Tax=Myotis myotis TaxID=51298 RepID=A0A7J7RHJ0_MYOMY|nr:hypothetical protein mMyoMyo1_010332 [Myotis myotis]